MCLFHLDTFAQKFEYVYKNTKDSTFNCYLKVLPPTDSIKGLIIRDFSALPDTQFQSPFQFEKLSAQAGFLTIYTVSSAEFPEFFIVDSIMDVLDNIVFEVVTQYQVPTSNIFIGGISVSGTRAMRYAQYCEQGKSKHGIKIKGVFAVDPPLDLARFYQSVFNNHNKFKEGMLEEAIMMKTVFEKLLKGAPDKHPNEYVKASVFSHSDSLGGNAIHLKSVNILLIHEPDLQWWKENRGATYFDINSYDIDAMVLKLRQLGNEHVEEIETSGKGFDRKGNRKCHSWTIVDEEYLLNWLLLQLKL
jgi:hypothetical protein